VTECPDTRSAWGSICRTCGVRLPAQAKPLKSWMAQRNYDEKVSEAARKSMKPHHVFRLKRDDRRAA
jgi:hypothetical protein